LCYFCVESSASAIDFGLSLLAAKTVSVVDRTYTSVTYPGCFATRHGGAEMVQQWSTALIGANTLFREGLKRALDLTHYQVQQVAETFDSRQQAFEPDLIIFIAGDDQAVLIDQVQQAKKDDPSTRIVVIGDIDSPEIVWALLGAGADGYLLRRLSVEASLASLDVVMLGGRVVPPMSKNALPIESKHSAGIEAASATARRKANREPQRLSDREMEILLCVMKGESNKIIARNFDIAEGTVKVHLKAILRKIRVSNRTQAAVWAHNNHLGHGCAHPTGANGYRGPQDEVGGEQPPLSS
jgi:two-component system nitrate/nitrite response regulator NarL